MTKRTSMKIETLDQLYREVSINVDKFIPHCRSNEIIYRFGGKTKEDLIQDIILTLLEKDNNKNIPFQMSTLTAAYARSRTFYYLTDAYRLISNKTPSVSFEDYMLDEVESEADASEAIFLDEVLSLLPDRDRKIMEYYLLGFSYREISSLMEEGGDPLTPNYIKFKIFRMKKELRDNLSLDSSL